MKRRDFIKNAGLLVSVTPFVGVATQALGDEASIIENLAYSDSAKACQSVQDHGNIAAAKEVNPNNEAGLLSNSIGCKTPHKHLLFIPNRYLENPNLIELEADAEENGVKAKRFWTSRAFDIGMFLKIANWIPYYTWLANHSHIVLITKSDIEAIMTQPQGITKIAEQPKLAGGGTEPGHLFRLARTL